MVVTLEAIIEAKEKELEVLKKHLKADVEKPVKEEKKLTKAESSKKTSKKEESDDVSEYSGMTAQALYKECCSRGISSKCKERNKAYLIKVLEADDAEKDSDLDDWGDEDSETPDYESMKAPELYKLCVERKIKTKKGMKAAEYVKLLKKADEAEKETDGGDDWGEDDSDGDDWEI